MNGSDKSIENGAILGFVPLFENEHAANLRRAHDNKVFADYALVVLLGVAALYVIWRLCFIAWFAVLVLTGGNRTYFQPLAQNGAKIGDAYEVGIAKDPSPDAVADDLRTVVTAAFSQLMNDEVSSSNTELVKHFLSPSALSQLQSRAALPAGASVTATVNRVRRIRDGSFEIDWTAVERTGIRTNEAMCSVLVTVSRFDGPPKTDKNPQDYWKKNAFQTAINSVTAPLGVAPPEACFEPQAVAQ